MKLKPKAIILTLVPLAAAVVGWWLINRTGSVVSEPAAPKATTPLSAQSHLATELIQPYAKTPYLGLKDSRWIDRRRLREMDPSYQWRTPIEFFGVVVDEDSQPVAGAVIEYSWTGTTEKYGGDGVEHRTITSDESGQFYIGGIEGKGMTILVSKASYYRGRSSGGGSFDYAAFWEPNFIEPDSNRPVVFRLVKRPVAEPTYHVDFRTLPRPPFWQTRIDFLAKPAETAAGGDVLVQMTRPSNPGYQSPFDWQLKIEGQGGAEVVMSNDEYLLLAPNDGYQKTILKDFKQVRGHSIETVKFYVRNKARKFYAAVSLEVTPYYPDHLTKADTACYIVSATVNPNDSRNLDYDPAKDIREMAKKR